MSVCPSCGSSRIRHDYKPAPLVLRMIGIRALLCDYCNHQFRVFSLRPQKSRALRHAKRKADVFNPAPAVDLNQLNRNVSAEKREPRRAINFDLSNLPNRPAPKEIAGQVMPIRRDLQTEITKLYAQGAKETPQPEDSAQNYAQQPFQECPECGSQNVKRRQRNVLERAALSLTDHKAFACHSCGASFYAKLGEDEREQSVINPSEAAFH